MDTGLVSSNNAIKGVLGATNYDGMNTMMQGVFPKAEVNDCGSMGKQD